MERRLGFCGNYGGKLGGSFAKGATCSRRARAKVTIRASTEEDWSMQTLKIVQDPKMNKFMLVDAKSNEPRELELREKEFLYLDALYSYGSQSERPTLSDEQFDLLKEDLTWQGSRVILLSEKEKKFFEAARAYYRGDPILNDEEFDTLREELRSEGSSIAVSKGPKCSLETMLCTTDCEEDKTRMLITLLPAAGIGALIWAAITYEVTPLRNVNHLYTLIGGLPIIALFSKIVTSIVLPAPSLILTGNCPNCGTEMRAYFGDIATIEGPKETSKVKCPECRAAVIVRESTRKMELDVANKK